MNVSFHKVRSNNSIFGTNKINKEYSNENIDLFDNFYGHHHQSQNNHCLNIKNMDFNNYDPFKKFFNENESFGEILQRNKVNLNERNSSSENSD